MPTLHTKLFYATDPERFETELQEHLYAISGDIFVVLESVQVSLAVGPGPLFAAVVTWESGEVDVLLYDHTALTQPFADEDE